MTHCAGRGPCDGHAHNIDEELQLEGWAAPLGQTWAEPELARSATLIAGGGESAAGTVQLRWDQEAHQSLLGDPSEAGCDWSLHGEVEAALDVGGMLQAQELRGSAVLDPSNGGLVWTGSALGAEQQGEIIDGDSPATLWVELSISAEGGAGELQRREEGEEDGYSVVGELSLP